MFVTGRHMNLLTPTATATNYTQLFIESGLCIYPFLYFGYFTCASKLSP